MNDYDSRMEMEGMEPQPGMGGMQPGMQLTPDMLLLMEKEKVKENLKRVREMELQGELEALLKSRQKEIEEESGELFSE